jgi:hypothetical protein
MGPKPVSTQWRSQKKVPRVGNRILVIQPAVILLSYPGSAFKARLWEMKNINEKLPCKESALFCAVDWNYKVAPHDDEGQKQ